MTNYLAGQVYRFDDLGKNPKDFSALTPKPGNEGIAGRRVGDGCEVFVANNDSTISVFDGTGTFLRKLTISGASSIAGLSFNSGGTILYAADYGVGKIFALNPASTGTVIPDFVGIGPVADGCEWHDVAVSTDGSVYATANGSNSAKCGVYKFSPNLQTFTQFVLGDNSLGKPSYGMAAGMAFDRNGNLWVTTFLRNTVYQLSTTSSNPSIPLQTIVSSLFSTPLGLALGPNDGNIYVADFGSGTVEKIDVGNGTVSQFVNPGTLSVRGPKYLWFTQNCNAATGCGADPLLALAGTWTFSMDGTAPSTAFAPAGPFAATGQFVATVGSSRGGSPVGLLSIVWTYSQGGAVVRLETDVGTFQIFPDCSGGSLTLNLSTRPVTFDFWFSKGGTEIRFVSTTPGVTIGGTAFKGGSACPIATDPLLTLAGRWVFTAEGFVPLTIPYASAGQFLASIGTRNGNPTGLLTITDSSNQSGQIVRLESAAGSYQIFPDCSGGSLAFNVSTVPITFDFWYAMGGTEIRFASTTGGVTVHGSATR